VPQSLGAKRVERDVLSIGQWYGSRPVGEARALAHRATGFRPGLAGFETWVSHEDRLLQLLRDRLAFSSTSSPHDWPVVLAAVPLCLPDFWLRGLPWPLPSSTRSPGGWSGFAMSH